MTNDKLAPKIRFKGFSDPWEQRKLNTIFDILDGDRGSNYPHESDFMKTGNTLFLDTGNVTKTGFNFKNKKYISKEKDGILRTGKLKVNDFIITSRGTLGNIAFYDDFLSQKYSSVRINSAMLILRPLPNNNVENVFVITQLRGNMVTSFLRRDHVGSAQPHITKHDFSKVEIIIPKNNMEQHEIGEEFKKMSQLIAANEDKVNQLKELKKLMMQKIFSQEWRFNGFTDPWEQRKLGDIANVTKLAGFEFTKYVNYSQKGKVIALRGLNVKSGKLNLSDVKYIDKSNFSKLSRSKLYKNDIVFTYVGTIGESAVIDTDDQFYLAPNVALIRLSNLYSAGFIHHYISNDIFWGKVIVPLISSSSQPALSMESIRKFKIDLPIELEQGKVNKIINSVDFLIAANEEKLEQLKQLKKYLMQNMFV